MSESRFTHRLASALFAGTVLLTAACSAEREAQPGHTRQTGATASGPAAPPAPVVPVETSPAAPGSAATSTPGAAPRLTVEGEGLRWFLQPSGTARPVPFGAPESEVLASLQFVRGPASKGTNEDCGAGPMQFASWPDGLNLVFQDGRFVGWGLDRRATHEITTTAGIGPGSTRAELGAAFSATVTQTSLGSEFSAGDLHGVLDGPADGARITDMWAGVSCVAR